MAEVFQKTAGASEPSSYTFSATNPCSSSTELQADYGITIWSNVASTPVDTASENVTDCGFGSHCSVVASAVTTTVANDMLVPMYFAGNREPNWTCTLPGGFNTAWSFQDDQFSITCAGYNSQSRVGSTGVLTGDLSGFGVNPSDFSTLAFLVAVPPGFSDPRPQLRQRQVVRGRHPRATATPTSTADSNRDGYYDRDSDCNVNGNCDADCDVNGNPDCDSDRHRDPDCRTYGNCDADSDGNRDRSATQTATKTATPNFDGNSDCDSDRHRDSDVNGDRDFHADGDENSDR